MRTVLLSLDDEVVAEIDAIVQRRLEENMAATGNTPQEIQQATIMCREDGSATRGNAYLAECIAKRRHVNTSRHALSKEFLLRGLLMYTSEAAKVAAPGYSGEKVKHIVRAGAACRGLLGCMRLPPYVMQRRHLLSA